MLEVDFTMEKYRCGPSNISSDVGGGAEQFRKRSEILNDLL